MTANKYSSDIFTFSDINTLKKPMNTSNNVVCQMSSDKVI